MLWSLAKLIFAALRKNKPSRPGVSAKSSIPEKSASIAKPNKTSSRLSDLSKVDSLIEKGKPEKAFKELIAKLGLKTNPQFDSLDSESMFHQLFLDRILNLAEARNVRLTSLNKLEKNLSNFADINDQLLKATMSLKSLEKRRKGSGKTLPEWSKKDFKSRIRDIQTERKAAIQSLREGLENTKKELFTKKIEQSKDSPTLH